MKHNLLFLHLLVVCLLSTYAQIASDKLLFSFPLINDPAKKSIFNIDKAERIRDALSGPIVMKKDHLLFYSRDGYVLFDQRGTVVDSFSIFKGNQDLKKGSPEELHLAFPVDPKTILFYKKKSSNGSAITIFEKNLHKRTVRPSTESFYDYYNYIYKKQVYNLAFNTLTDDMIESYMAKNRLVGYSGLPEGQKWWSVDKFYLHSSPLVFEEQGQCKSIFPGMIHKQNNDKLQTIEPLQIFSRYDRLFYTGISTRIGNKDEVYTQSYYVFDQAGNILYQDTLFKLDNMNVIIGEDETTYYTVKKIKRNVFKPAVSNSGDLYYGIIDYENKKIDVRKRAYTMFLPSPSKAKLEELINDEKCVEYVPLRLACNGKAASKKVLPKITLLDKKSNKYVRAQAEHLSHQGFVCYIQRTPDRAIQKKLDRSGGGIPRRIRSIIDSLSKTSTVKNPYSLEIQGPKREISFKYPPGEDIICARVIAVTNAKEVILRVDCAKYAEVLLFSTGGEYVNRFVFNKQDYEERQDIVVASASGTIIELDYESDPEMYKYFSWKRR